jgi:7,8-dihydropterin-6-yl-methyl-4-(beta-D-ribofuranosyl)aminobenzene 5'-phosphate synthase
MKIITLIENLVYKTGLTAEHGLALLIDTGNQKILFDTGQSPAFLSNAEKLGVNMKEIDSVIISHGHYDHTGGLYAFLQKNSKAKVFAKKEVFLEKYQTVQGFIGTPYKPDMLKNRITYIKRITEIDKGVFINPDIPILDPVDTSFKDFTFNSNNKNPEPDEFSDELFLAFTQNDKLTIVSSCSHRGITNITRAAISQFNLQVHLILGGFHLKDCSSEQYLAVTNYLLEVNPDYLGICHCTGVNRYVDLKCDFKDKVFYNMTGNIYNIY